MTLRGADIEAEITLLPLAAGGRSAARTGYRPAHRILPNYLTTGVHEYLDGAELDPGKTARGRITFVTPEVYPHCLHVGQVLDVQEGDRIVGHAKVTRILNRLLDREVTSREFAEAWGADSLVRLHLGAAPPDVPTDAVAYLVEAGLPALFVLAHPTLPATASFGRLSSGLTELVAEAMVGPSAPLDWLPYLILGDEHFDNGGAWYCVDRATGHVVRVDPELERPVALVNTTVPRFAAAMLASISWTANVLAFSPSWSASVSLLADLLWALDPAALEVENSHWKKVVASVADAEPHAFQFLRASTSGDEVDEDEYAARADELSQITADALSAARPDPSRVRAILAGFLERGARAGFTTGQLVDLLGVSSPSILERAGFLDEEATVAMDVMAALTDEEIAAARPWSPT